MISNTMTLAIGLCMAAAVAASPEPDEGPPPTATTSGPCAGKACGARCSTCTSAICPAVMEYCQSKTGVLGFVCDSNAAHNCPVSAATSTKNTKTAAAAPANLCAAFTVGKPCVDANNRKACLDLEAQGCTSLRVMESCPLQLSCEVMAVVAAPTSLCEAFTAGKPCVDANSQKACLDLEAQGCTSLRVMESCPVQFACAPSDIGPDTGPFSNATAKSNQGPGPSTAAGATASGPTVAGAVTTNAAGNPDEGTEAGSSAAHVPAFAFVAMATTAVIVAM